MATKKLTGYDGPGKELVVPFDGDPLTMKKLARRQRRQERKEAARRGLTADQYRKMTRGEAPDPKNPPRPIRTTAKIAGPFMAKDEYREKLLLELALPQHPDPENEHWLGFSLDELQKEAPDPKTGAALVIKRVAEYSSVVTLEAVVVFRERLLGVGPWKQPPPF